MKFRPLYASTFLLFADHNAYSEMRVGAGFKTGPQYFAADQKSQLNGIGFFADVHANLELRETFGDVAFGVGTQQTKQIGDTKAQSQEMNTRTTLLSASYVYKLSFLPFHLGGLFQNSIGKNARFVSNTSNDTQWMLSLGPKLEFRQSVSDSLDFVVTGAALKDLNLQGRYLWQFPLSAGFSLALTNQKQQNEMPKSNTEPQPIEPNAEPSNAPSSNSIENEELDVAPAPPIEPSATPNVQQPELDEESDVEQIPRSPETRPVESDLSEVESKESNL